MKSTFCSSLSLNAEDKEMTDGFEGTRLTRLFWQYGQTRKIFWLGEQAEQVGLGDPRGDPWGDPR